LDIFAHFPPDTLPRSVFHPSPNRWCSEYFMGVLNLWGSVRNCLSSYRSESPLKPRLSDGDDRSRFSCPVLWNFPTLTHSFRLSVSPPTAFRNPAIQTRLCMSTFPLPVSSNPMPTQYPPGSLLQLLGFDLPCTALHSPQPWPPPWESYFSAHYFQSKDISSIIAQLR